MIVVIGSPAGRVEAGHVFAAGLASTVAIAAAAAGRIVQLVGRIGDDAAADAVLQDLVRHGVGHVAILRDAAHATPVIGSDDDAMPPPTLEAADVELALRYLTDFAVLVVIDEGASIRAVVDRAAAWGGASLIVVAAQGSADEPEVAPGPVRLAPAKDETVDAFANRVGTLAANLDEARPTVRSGR